MLRSTLKSRIRGSALISLVGVLVVMSLLGTTAVTLTQTTDRVTLDVSGPSRSHYLAESGLQVARYLHAVEGGVNHPVLRLATGDTVQVNFDASTSTFTATATVATGSALQARARTVGGVLAMGPPPPPPPVVAPAYQVMVGTQFNSGAGTVGGSIRAGSVETSGTYRTYVQGDIISDTTASLQRTIVEGDVYTLGGDFFVGSYMSRLEGDVYVFGNAVLGTSSGGVLQIAGDVIATGNIEVARRGATVQGDVHAGGNVFIHLSDTGGSIYATGDVTLFDQSLVPGDIHAGGNVYLHNSTTDTRTVRGNIYAGGNVHFRGRTVVGTEGDPATGQVSAGGNIIFEDHRYNRFTIMGEAKAAGPRNDATRANVLQVVPAPTPPTPPRLPSDYYGPVVAPKGTNFTAGSTNIVVGAGVRTLAPGRYGSLTANIPRRSSGDLRLRSGNYYFTTVAIDGGRETYRLLIDLSSGRPFNFFATGNVVATESIYVSLDGTNFHLARAGVAGGFTEDQLKEIARLVYWETRGNLALTTRDTVVWLGTVLAWQSVQITEGARWVGLAATINGTVDWGRRDVHMVYSLADYARDNWVPDE